MTVNELREKLEQYHSEAEVLIITEDLEARKIDGIGLNPYFEDEVENIELTPVCITHY